MNDELKSIWKWSWPIFTFDATILPEYGQKCYPLNQDIWYLTFIVHT